MIKFVALITMMVGLFGMVMGYDFLMYGIVFKAKHGSAYMQIAELTFTVMMNVCMLGFEVGFVYEWRDMVRHYRKTGIWS